MKFILLLILYIIFNIYIIYKIKNWLNNLGIKNNLTKNSFLIIFIIWTTTPILTYFLPLSKFQKIINFISNIYIGILFYIIIINIIFIIIKLFNKKILKKDFTIYKTKKKLYIYSLVCILSIFIIMLYGFIHAKDIKIKYYNIDINKQSDISNLKIALISDLHLGYNVGYQMINQMVDKINDEHVDIVLIAGDIFDNSTITVDNIEKVEQSFSELHSEYGTYAILGNHDVNERLFCGFTVNGNNKRLNYLNIFFKNSNIKLLDDEILNIGNINIIGRQDYEKNGFNTKRKDIKNLIKNINKDNPIIVLQHEPLELNELARLNVDLNLSGHTHGGQFFPLTLIKYFNNNFYGLHRINNMNSVITSGIGVFGPNIRINSKSEITIINLKFKNN